MGDSKMFTEENARELRLCAEGVVDLRRDVLNSAKKIDENSRKIDENSRKIDELARKTDDNSQKIDELARKTDDNSRKIDELARRTDDNSGKIADNTRRIDEGFARMETLFEVARGDGQAIYELLKAINDKLERDKLVTAAIDDHEVRISALEVAVRQ